MPFLTNYSKVALLTAPAALMLFVAPSAMAQTSGSQTQATAPEEQAEAPKEKKICRRVQMTGSRMATRICRTEQQWETADATEGSDLSTKAKESIMPAPNPLGGGPGR